MHFRDFRTGWRLLAKEPAYSTVVVCGLAVGFTACFLLLGFVRYCFSYDSQVPDRDHVYVMQHRVNLIPNPTWIEFMPLPFREAAMGSGLASEVSAAVPRKAVFDLGDRRQAEEVIAVDAAFPAMFGIVARDGDLQAALSHPDGLALTAGLARKLFGSPAALGRAVTVDGKAFRVMAMLDDAPSNTTMPYLALVGAASALWNDEERKGRAGSWQALGGKIYLRLKDKASPGALATALQDAADRSPWKQLAPALAGSARAGHVIEVRLHSLAEAYFDTEVAGGSYGGPRGERKTVLALGAVALLILGLAAANYVNLASVRTLHREREIGVRKAVGAGAGQLAGQFVAESMLVATIAGALGMLVAWMLLPLFAELMDRQLDGMLAAPTFAAGLLLALLIGAATGLHPAWIALRIPSAAVLTGRSGSESRRGLWLRRGLSVFQFAAASALTAATLAIAWQTAFATRIDPGFDSGPLSVLVLPRDATDPQRRALRDALARLPEVEGVAVSGTPIGAPGVMKGSTTLKNEAGTPLPVKLQWVSANFFDVFRLRPLAGRLFDPAIDTAPPETRRVAVVNMTAMRALGFTSAEDAIGKRIDGWTIVGIAPEVRDQTLREPTQATVYQVDARQNALTLRSTADSARLYALVEPLWRRHFPDQPLELRRQQSYYAENYADDARVAKLLAAASAVAIAIAAFGIYVLAAYSVQRRSREIVLRKLHGAGRADIARLVGREFAALAAAGAAIGLPPAALAIERYLAGFAERAPMGAWPLACAFACAALVAAAATSRHTLLAIRITPALALRE